MEEFEDLGARHVAISADPPEKLRSFREHQEIDERILLLSDPHLEVASTLDVATSSGHPKAKQYPEGAFLQPAVFVWDDEEERRFEWRIDPGLLNLWGAVRRMKPREVLERVRELDSGG